MALPPNPNTQKNSRGRGVNRSSTITLGGTAQNIVASNPRRQGLLIQNVSDTVMWVNAAGATAVADSPSFKLAVDGVLKLETTSAVSVLCATTGKKFSALEW